MKTEIKLNMGCGKDILDGWINLDRQKGAGIDVVHDLEKYPYPFKDNTFDVILCKSVLEHLWDADRAIRELHRILKKGGILKIHVPYFNAGSAYRTTHHTFFSKDAFLMYTKDASIRAGLDARPLFNTQKLELLPTRFGRIIPKPIRYYASLVLGEVYHSIDIVFIKI